MRLITQFAIFIILTAISVCLPTELSAQFISLKSVPVATGDQFLTLPSEHMAQGGAGIALPAPAAEAFSNPALGSQVGDIRLFGAPTLYSITNQNGSGRTLPLGLQGSSGQWFMGLAIGAQQLVAPREEGFAVPFQQPFWLPQQTRLNDRQKHNFYFNGYLAKQLNPASAVGLGISYAGLAGVEGVELLYANSSNIKQHGNTWDIRGGWLREWQNHRVLEAVFLFNSFDMIHDVSYPYWFVEGWDSNNFDDVVTRNRDKTATWGAHLNYRQPLTRETGWNIGGLFTVNRKSHPKIPNYEIMNIPRDPGRTWAFNAGVGISREYGPTIFAY